MNIIKKIKTTSLITGVIFSSIHIINKALYHISTTEDYLYTKNENFYNWRFGKIFYTKQGKGNPILLIHDLNVCSSSYEWHEITKELSKTNTVYTIDLLGCGNSDKPNLTYTNYLYVQLITDFIKQIIGRKTDLIATNFSSSIAIMTCSNNNEMINKIMLVNPANMTMLSKNPNKHTKALKFLIYMPVIGTFIYNIMLNKKTIEKDFNKTYFYNYNYVKEKDILTYLESSQKNNTHGKYLYANIKGRFTNINILRNLKKINNDIFIITGNANPENRLAADQYQNYLPSIEIAGIDETKLLPQLEKPEEFLDKVKILFYIE